MVLDDSSMSGYLDDQILIGHLMDKFDEINKKSDYLLLQIKDYKLEIVIFGVHGLIQY